TTSISLSRLGFKSRVYMALCSTIWPLCRSNPVPVGCGSFLSNEHSKSMAELLVSVRSAAEAEAALKGGAGLIDVKEPRRGSLGRAADTVIAAVCQCVGHRRPVSAALGELTDRRITFPCRGLAYAKWGLSGCLDHPAWRTELTAAAHSLRQAVPGCQPVAVGYADWRSAHAPKPADVCAFACEHRWGAFLLDTWEKNGKTL